jgi:Ras-related protein Rab-6A
MGDGMLVTPMPKYKLVFLGDIYVGKTSIINQFMYENFDTNYQATIGIDFLSKTLTIGDKSMRLQLWDTAGQERFRSLIPNYIRDSSAAVIVYDVTNKQTFASLDKWVEDVRNERGNGVVIAIVGNKTDKTGERCVTTEEAETKAKQLGAIYQETSAKTGANVKELFKEIASSITNDKTPQIEIKKGINLVQQPQTLEITQQKKANCC